MLSLWTLCGTTAAQTYPSSSGKSDSFTLSGSVVNSVTGEPIGHALVRVSGNTQRTAFSDGEGHFQFQGMPAGMFSVSAQKPGYFSEMESGQGINPVTLGPSADSVVVKLSPHSVISGRVVDATGQPIEHVPVRLTAKALREGRKHWEGRGQQQTDEDGRYRFGDLMPGTYYVAAGPGRDVMMRIMRGAEGPKMGYPSVYYPGVPDLASAAPIQLAAGQHVEAEFSMTAGPLYTVSGTVTGFHPQQGVSFQFWSQSGDDLSVSVKFDSETGRFDVNGVPSGSYTVKAFSGGDQDQPFRGQMHLNVAGNVENLHMVLGPAISIPVVVKTESRAAAANQAGMQGPPVSVRLIPFDASTSESYSTMVRGKPGAYSVVLQNVEPGKYSVELTPQGLWYVQSAQYGQTNLLYDDLTIASGGTSYPMEIVLRDDGPSLTGTVKAADGKETEATVVAVPEPASKLATKVTHVYGASTFGFAGLAPGEYLIYAFDSDRMEYTNPDVLQAYASQAVHVTLSANQKSQIALELIRTGEGE